MPMEERRPCSTWGRMLLGALLAAYDHHALDCVPAMALLPAGLRVWRLRVRAPWEEPLGGIVLRFGLIAGASCGLILTLALDGGGTPKPVSAAHRVTSVEGITREVSECRQLRRADRVACRYVFGRSTKRGAGLSAACFNVGCIKAWPTGTITMLSSLVRTWTR